MDRCPLCQSQDVSLLYASNLPEQRSGSRYDCTSFGLGLHPDIFRCRSCSFVFNEPATGELDHLEEYAQTEDPDYLDQKLSRRLTYDRELERIEAHAAGRELLDVGCYAGFFLEQARERDYDVAGVEPSIWGARHAAEKLGLDVFNGPIEAFRTERRFDVVTMWDVIEHLENPLEVLRTVHRLMHPGGVLAFTTHNLDSLAARLMRGRYPFFMEMHTVHLNDRTRDLLLAKAGFERIAVLPHRRALRLGYLVSRLRRLGEWPVGAADRLARAFGVVDRIVWVGGVGLETILARPLERSP